MHLHSCQSNNLCIINVHSLKLCILWQRRWLVLLVDRVASDNLVAPHLVALLCPAQLRQGGVQVF